MASKFWDPQNTFWSWIGRVPAMLCLSVLWLIMCIPIVTIVPASIALYDATARNLRPDEKGMFARYFRTFWKELGRGILLSILWVLILLLLWYGSDLLALQAENSESGSPLAVIYQVSLMIPLATFLWMIPLESRFEFKFFGLLKSSLAFAVSYLPQTLIILVLFAAALVACYLYIPLMFFMPVLFMLFISIPVEKVFDKYMNPPEE